MLAKLKKKSKREDINGASWYALVCYLQLKKGMRRDSIETRNALFCYFLTRGMHKGERALWISVCYLVFQG